jgi:hypothetical protein
MTPLIAWLVACGGGEAPAPPSEAAPEPAVEATAPAPASDADALALASAETAARAVGRTLKERLTGVMSADGPVAGIEVCSAEAQGLTAQIGSEHGARVGRSSLRLRNPANAAPPWVEAWLRQQGERPAEGVGGFSRIEEEGDARFARFVAPIAVEAPCVACHGPADALPATVTGLIRERYPSDAATGYNVGDLRGALWAEVALPPR